MRDREGIARIATSIRRAASCASPRLELFGLLLLALLGIGLRLRQYLFNRSLRMDEVSLALSVVNRDVSTLLTEPLAYLQSAPPGFLFPARLMVVIIGPHDWALRLVPLIAGLSVVILAVVLARRELTSAVARLTFVGLVALTPVLIFYSSEFKPYSSDALAAIAILVALSYRSSPHATWLLAGVGFVALVCSLPAVFVAAPAGLLLFYEAIRSHRYKQVLIVGLAWLAGAALHGAYILQAGTDREAMVAFWSAHGGFPPFPPHSTEDLAWYPKAFSGLVRLIFKIAGPATPEPHKELRDFSGWAPVVVFAASLAAVSVSRRRVAIVAASAILMTAIASVFEIYPFSSRLLIFLVPLALFIIATAIDILAVTVGSVVAGFFALLLFSVMAPIAIEGLIEPRSQTNFKEALRVVQENSISGDALAMEAWGGKAFAFYRGSDARALPTFMLDEREPARSLLERVKREGYRRVWYLESRPTPPAALNLTQEVARTTPIVFTWGRRGTRLVLFDFTPKSQ